MRQVSGKAREKNFTIFFLYLDRYVLYFDLMKPLTRASTNTDDQSRQKSLQLLIKVSILPQSIRLYTQQSEAGRLYKVLIISASIVPYIRSQQFSIGLHRLAVSFASVKDRFTYVFFWTYQTIRSGYPRSRGGADTWLAAGILRVRPRKSIPLQHPRFNNRRKFVTQMLKTELFVILVFQPVLEFLYFFSPFYCRRFNAFLNSLNVS